MRRGITHLEERDDKGYGEGGGKKYERDAEEINVTRKWPGEGTGNQQMKVEQSISLILLNKI